MLKVKNYLTKEKISQSLSDYEDLELYLVDTLAKAFSLDELPTCSGKLSVKVEFECSSSLPRTRPQTNIEASKINLMPSSEPVVPLGPHPFTRHDLGGSPPYQRWGCLPIRRREAKAENKNIEKGFKYALVTAVSPVVPVGFTEEKGMKEEYKRILFNAQTPPLRRLPQMTEPRSKPTLMKTEKPKSPLLKVLEYLETEF